MCYPGNFSGSVFFFISLWDYGTPVCWLTREAHCMYLSLTMCGVVLQVVISFSLESCVRTMLGRVFTVTFIFVLRTPYNIGFYQHMLKAGHPFAISVHFVWVRTLLLKHFKVKLKAIEVSLSSSAFINSSTLRYILLQCIVNLQFHYK